MGGFHAEKRADAMNRVGVPGERTRRAVSGLVVALGLLNITLAVVRHPIISFGRFHNRIPIEAVESSRYLLLASAVALLSSAPGLLHGKRHAWTVAALATLVSLLAHPFKRLDYLGVGASGLVLAVLIAGVSLFPARSDPARARRGMLWLALGETGVLLYGLAGLYLLDSQFRDTTSFSEAVENAFRLLFVVPATTIEPASRHGTWFIHSARLCASGVLAAGIWQLLRPVLHRAGPGRLERVRVRGLLERYAANSVAYFHLLDDKTYFFASSGEAFIGYRMVGATAVALGEPIGETFARNLVVREFAEFCDLNGWAFCFHQATEAGAADLRNAGLTAMKIGEEAVIPVAEFSLAGKSFKHIRNAVNRLEREGYRCEALPRPIPAGTMSELEDVSNAWLAGGERRERGFTLGHFSRDYLTETEVHVVRAPRGAIEAFANVIPSFQSKEGNFDLMRRRPDAEDGVMDFLFVHLIEHFRVAGMDGVNLGMAPLANLEGGGLVTSALRLLYSRGSRFFSYEGLRAYKEKWKPRWEPRYLVYRSDLQLPQLVLAVARVGETTGRLPWSWKAQAARLLPWRG